MKRARVVLADNHHMVTKGLKNLLSAEFDVVGVVEDGLALIDAARRLAPDVVVTDISMPGIDGLKALEILKKDNDKIKVILLTMHLESIFVDEAFRAGASGYVLKYSAPAELTAAVRAALDGKTYLSGGFPDKRSMRVPGVASEPSQSGDDTGDRKVPWKP